MLLCKERLVWLPYRQISLKIWLLQSRTTISACQLAAFITSKIVIHMDKELLFHHQN